MVCNPLRWLSVVVSLTACSEAAPVGDTGWQHRGSGWQAEDTGEVAPPRVVFNEVVSGRTDGGPDWIELYNGGEAEAFLTGWRIGDDPEGEGWPFPADAAVAPGGFLVVFASDSEGEPGELHADFKLSGSGETLLLWSAQGGVADEVDVPELEDDQSYARQGDGGATWVVSTSPSMGAPNG